VRTAPADIVEAYLRCSREMTLYSVNYICIMGHSCRAPKGLSVCGRAKGRECQTGAGIREWIILNPAVQPHSARYRLCGQQFQRLRNSPFW
jgi:hypothetical protein